MATIKRIHNKTIILELEILAFVLNLLSPGSKIHKEQTTIWLVISWQFSTSFHSNVQHIRNQVCQHDAKIYIDFCSVLGLYQGYFCDICAGKRYSWCRVHCYSRVATDTFCSHSNQELHDFQSHSSIFLWLFQCVHWNIPVPHEDCRFRWWHSN